jgi:hypothetical protein
LPGSGGRGRGKEADGCGEYCGDARPSEAEEKEGRKEGEAGADRWDQGVGDKKEKGKEVGDMGRCGEG